jgi:uracil-DNA glycosylase
VAFRSIASLQRANRACRACAEAGYRIESQPIFAGRAGQLAYLYGQAPGAAEAAEGRPWRGRAGRTLRRWLEMDEEEFYATFYCAAVTRCYPGKAPGGRGDRAASAREQELCAFWREWELRLLRPRLVVTVGGLAARRLLGVGQLTAVVGRRLELGGIPAIPLPHPSGASGWLNDPANRRRLEQALALLRGELARLQARPGGPLGGPPGRLGPDGGARAEGA